jgi:hypothetical protein
MDDFIRRFDALPDEEREKIYIRIGQMSDKFPPFMPWKEYVAAVLEQIDAVHPGFSELCGKGETACQKTSVITG